MSSRRLGGAWSLVRRTRRKTRYNVTYTTNSSRGRILLCYIPHAFSRIMMRRPRHQNVLAARLMAGVFGSQGYTVDVCDHQAVPPAGRYEIAIGLESALTQVEQLQRAARTIYLATGAHYEMQNAAEAARIARITASRGVELRSRRAVRPHPTADLADAVACVGGVWARESYAVRNLRVVHLREPSLLEPARHDRPRSSDSEFLWLGGAGMVHKGLDLALEAIARCKGAILHVVGPVLDEDDFVAAYHRELAMENVMVHGWVSARSRMMMKLIERCRCVVLPSCSEGTAGSVIAAMSQGLVPIVTLQAGIDGADDIGWLIPGTVDAVADAFDSALTCSHDELERRSRDSLALVAKEHTADTYQADVVSLLRLAASDNIG